MINEERTGQNQRPRGEGMWAFLDAVAEQAELTEHAIFFGRGRNGLYQSLARGEMGPFPLGTIETSPRRRQIRG